jgi:hypothetical protein
LAAENIKISGKIPYMLGAIAIYKNEYLVVYSDNL